MQPRNLLAEALLKQLGMLALKAHLPLLVDKHMRTQHELLVCPCVLLQQPCDGGMRWPLGAKRDGAPLAAETAQKLVRWSVVNSTTYDDHD